MSAGKLPEGWVETQLGKIIELKYGKSLAAPSRDGKYFPVYGSNGIVGMHSAPLINGAGLIVGRKGSYGVVQKSTGPFFPIDTTYYIDDFYNQPIDYWYYYLTFLPLTKLNRSTAIPGLNREDAYNLNIVIPSLAEQKIIAEKLDTLLAQVDSAKARLEQIPQILKRFRQAVLTFAMNGELTKEWRSQNNNPAFFSAEKNSLKQFRNKELPSIPNNWSWMRFDQVADIASKLKSPLDYPNTIHLAPNHIESWTGKASGYQTILEDGVTSAKHEFYTGQIIYSKIRPYLCKVTIATFDGMCSADMYPINSKIDTHFLFRWMLTNTFTDWASNAESRTVLPKINQKDLSEIPVPTPPLPEQAEIVRRVEQLFAYADTIEKQVNNALARVNNLTQSILAKAFRGELTAQWRAENPELISGENSAAALLEKIKAERAASGGKKASRKKS
ncbi:restriction endonuclease subunit S [Escherichia marmotae]|uniref:restriction endonuclease subunit S n=1 Tax=Escherichia marmotae TaxID=1499973 RepID=UPI0023B20A24|nr:restriction endonuclease subunit S [Escherichia marmotae]MDE9779208.1 restriction endonuclease subunit S [Escherichia marmotae]MED9196943.1 restriction endonuclease subunit S [Escherichia marmotae]